MFDNHNASPEKSVGPFTSPESGLGTWPCTCAPGRSGPSGPRSSRRTLTPKHCSDAELEGNRFGVNITGTGLFKSCVKLQQDVVPSPQKVTPRHEPKMCCPCFPACDLRDRQTIPRSRARIQNLSSSHWVSSLQVHIYSLAFHLSSPFKV